MRHAVVDLLSSPLRSPTVVPHSLCAVMRLGWSLAVDKDCIQSLMRVTRADKDLQMAAVGRPMNKDFTVVQQPKGSTKDGVFPPLP